MENHCIFIAVKCTNGYTNQLEGSTNVSKTLGNCTSSTGTIYKCYGDYDFMICLNPSSQEDAWKLAEECTTKLRSQPWVTTTVTTFGKECYTATSTSKERAHV